MSSHRGHEPRLQCQYHLTANLTILLDTKNRVFAMPTIYRGSLHTTVIRVSELFKEAVRQNCAALIVAHNHPSGDPTPSPKTWR